jgi:hypothetical protein
MTAIDRLLEIAPHLDASSRHQIEKLLAATDELRRANATLEKLVADRNLEVVRSVDVYGIDKPTIAKATELSPSRVNQILAELS